MAGAAENLFGETEVGQTEALSLNFAPVVGFARS